MAKFKCELPTQLINELTKLEQNTPKMMEEMTKAGAEIVKKNVISNMRASFKDSKKLEPYLRVTRSYRTRSGSVNTKVAFYGYYKKGSKSFKVKSSKF